MEVRVAFKNSILPQIQTMGLFHVEQDWFHYDRNIEIDTMLFVIKGSVNVCEEGIDYRIEEGQAFFLKLNLHHWGNVITPAGSRWFWICFTPFPGEGVDDIQWLPKHSKVSNPLQLRVQLEAMHELYNSRHPFKNQINNSQLYQIFIGLLNQSFEGGVKSHKKILVDKLITILREISGTRFSAERISKEMNMNYSYLCRIFKSVVGVTINQYYTELKIQKSIDLLQSTDLTITQISDQLGFPNPYYFSRVFKKTTGFSPRDHQNQMYR